jgi:hypothetical protein
MTINGERYDRGLIATALLLRDGCSGNQRFLCTEAAVEQAIGMSLRAVGIDELQRARRALLATAGHGWRYPGLVRRAVANYLRITAPGLFSFIAGVIRRRTSP